MNAKYQYQDIVLSHYYPVSRLYSTLKIAFKHLRKFMDKSTSFKTNFQTNPTL